MERIKNVEGNFRQKEILNVWKDFTKKNKEEQLIKIKIKVSCSSGTYIRRLASDIGEKLGCGAFALAIVRNVVVGYFQEDCLELVG